MPDSPPPVERLTDPPASPELRFSTAPTGGQIIKIPSLKTPQALRDRVATLHWHLPIDEHILAAQEGSPMVTSFRIGNFLVGDRWCTHAMEGWDGMPDGTYSDLTLRRWQRNGEGGAKLIWGCEACAVQQDGRANPNQLMATAAHEASLAFLLKELRTSHKQHNGTTDDLLVGLQLTHSGRFSRPNDKKLEPRIAYHHPLLDKKFGIDPANNAVVWTDDDLERLIDKYVEAPKVAQNAGYQFVDVKACHGYLLHEFLSAYTRPGKYGGDLHGRSKLLIDIIDRIRAECPQLMIGVRLSVFDTVPYETSTEVGRPMPFEHLKPYEYGFGVDMQNPLNIDLREPIELMKILQDHGVVAINLSAGSPYYCPHIQRPAGHPPSDGYLPPEDPLAGVARLINVTHACKKALPGMPMVGTGYSHLQDYVPHVAQGVVREGWVDFVGLGRMMLSYPDLPAETKTKGRLSRSKICRTLSRCTSEARRGNVSGCYPLDEFFKDMPEEQRSVTQIGRKF